ncbi:MAG: TIGR02680 family protein, partial [Micromonosporaceae bacterium]|nr:TIGR02680 family protein [Micromonosporaceae bacterium]
MSVTRFRPSRAGIINLWDYRDEEFVFVNGWLVLRGPNGSGKTKALEVLFPFVLDGRIEPRRLNPFASEERTMKSNVLYRGQDLNYAYVWMEFHRLAAEGGEEEFVTIGIGLRAHRHQDRVQRWHFVTDGRVGADFSLLDADDRPLNRRELAAELGEEHVYDGLEQYRRAVDARLFGLGPQRYEQFLDLVLTLRKPQLAKDLNPVELSRTLQRGLRPLDESLIAQAAGSFDHMEAVAKTLEGLVAAEQATMSFLSVYTTYLRTHARAAADAVNARRAEVTRARQALAEAERARERAQAEYRAAQEELRAAEGEPGRLRARLESLKSSAAYRSHQALEDLRRHVADLAAIATRAQAAAAQEATTVNRYEAEQAAAARRAEEAEQAELRTRSRLAEEAEAAGIAWPAEDAAPDGLAERIGARAQARRDDVRAVREKAERLAQAEREHARAAREVERAREAVAAAEEALLAAQARLDQARDALRDAVRRWGQSHADVLAEMDAVPAVAALEAAVDDLGAADGRSLAEVYGEQTAAGLRRLDQEVADRTAQRSIVDGRRAAVAQERELIAAARDDAPPRLPARPADRTDRPGAPLWRLVDFAPSVTPDEAAAIEAALEAAGLLDAWVHPDPALTAEAVAARERDGYLVALEPARRPSGRTLADLLVVEEPGRAEDHESEACHAAGAVPPAVVTAVLASIAVEDSLPTGQPGAAGKAGGGEAGGAGGGWPVVSVQGQYALGIVLG